MGETMTSKPTHELVGHDHPRKDGAARVTGREIYSVDVSLPRMLHGRILGSPYAHAIVKSIDASAAVAMGATVVTFADVPQAPTIGAVLVFSSSGVDSRDEPTDSGVTTRPRSPAVHGVGATRRPGSALPMVM